MPSIQTRLSELEKRAEPDHKVSTIMIIPFDSTRAEIHQIADQGSGLWTRGPDEAHDDFIARARRVTSYAGNAVVILFALTNQKEAADASA